MRKSIQKNIVPPYTKSILCKIYIHKNVNNFPPKSRTVQTFTKQAMQGLGFGILRKPITAVLDQIPYCAKPHFCTRHSVAYVMLIKIVVAQMYFYEVIGVFRTASILYV